jgi:intracellular sulfur oxidation DsrE/DsrF family protein
MVLINIILDNYSTMNPDKHNYIALLRIWIIYTVLFIHGCDNNGDKNITVTTENKAPPDIVQNITEQPEAAPLVQETVSGSDLPDLQFNIGNKSYLFDVSNHSMAELEALLGRAEEITQATSGDYDHLEIVMVLHGPDIEWFTQDNFENNKQLVELAARLDSYEIIDLKVCETTMKKQGIEREDIPAFIESVPYAPDFMKRLVRKGYINL